MTMRNRKTIITAFVLLACLLIGVGYAAVTGTLNITGATTFYSYGETSGTVHSAVKFKSAEVLEAYKEVASTSLTGDDTADLTIVFTDTNETTEYVAVAKYNVVYETAEAAMPKVEFSVPTIDKGGSNATYKIYLDEARTNEWTDADDIILSPNATTENFDFWVEVTYTETGSETGILKAFPKITLNYESLD